MRGKPGQIKVEGDEISGDGANYSSKYLEIRDGIITRLSYPAVQAGDDKPDADAGGFIGYICRHPQPSTWDFSLLTTPALITDGSTYTMDLSDIVPEGAHAVIIDVRLKDGVAGSEFMMKHHDHGNYIGGSHIVSVIANQVNCKEQILHICEHRKLKYTATNTTFTELQLVVKGWWIH